jgi:hypothetical protein
VGPLKEARPCEAEKACKSLGTLSESRIAIHGLMKVPEQGAEKLLGPWEGS